MRSWKLKRVIFGGEERILSSSPAADTTRLLVDSANIIISRTRAEPKMNGGVCDDVSNEDDADDKATSKSSNRQRPSSP